jgi:hypothetical protein
MLTPPSGLRLPLNDDVELWVFHVQGSDEGMEQRDELISNRLDEVNCQSGNLFFEEEKKGHDPKK